MLVDVSMPLSPSSIPVPGHPSPTFEQLHLLERDGLRNTVVTLSLHTSTHVDAPSHFIADGKTIDEIPVDRFHRPGIRLDLTGCPPGAAIGLSDLEAAGFDAPFEALVQVDLPTYQPDRCPLCARGLPVVKPGSRPGLA